jgi:hypothetical protein
LAELSNRAKSYKDKSQIKPNKKFSQYYIKPPATRYLLYSPPLNVRSAATNIHSAAANEHSAETDIEDRLIHQGIIHSTLSKVKVKIKVEPPGIPL